MRKDAMDQRGGGRRRRRRRVYMEVSVGPTIKRECAPAAAWKEILLSGLQENLPIEHIALLYNGPS